MSKKIKLCFFLLISVFSIAITLAITAERPQKAQDGQIVYATLNVTSEIKVQTEASTEPTEETITDTAAEETEEQEETTEYGDYIGQFVLTAYCPCERCCGQYALNRPVDDNGNQIVYTASGAVARQNHTIAVDPDVIPYGTEVIINGNVYVAEDCGGGINGNRIDVYFEDHDIAWDFGMQTADVYLKK